MICWLIDGLIHVTHVIPSRPIPHPTQSISSTPSPQLLQRLEAGKSEFNVRVSFLELYNEELFDLLDNSTAVAPVHPYYSLPPP